MPSSLISRGSGTSIAAVFMTPGREEEWTLSVMHTDDDVDLFVAAVRRAGTRR